MPQKFISNEHLDELFTKLRFSPNSKAKNEVRGIINDELQDGATYPDEAAKEIISFLEIDSADFLTDIIEILKPLFSQNSSIDFDFHPDNL